MYNDATIDQFIVDFYSSYPSEIKVSHALGWSHFGISDTKLNFFLEIHILMLCIESLNYVVLCLFQLGIFQ